MKGFPEEKLSFGIPQTALPMNPNPPIDETAARAYWTQKMEEALEFQETMRTYPVEECGEPLVSLRDAADGLDVEFSTTLINDCHPRVYFCREGLIASFQVVARAMNDRGWVLKVEDGYRSPTMQRAQSHNPRHFDLVLQKAMWELGGAVPDAAFLLRRMSALIATRCRVGTHVSGSAIDVSVLDRTTRREFPRGGRGPTYVEISERTPMDSPFVTAEERRNREKITALFQEHGWKEYPWEFWHYSQGDCYAEFLTQSGKPSRYGPVDFDGTTATPLDPVEADLLLEPVEFYETQMSAAFARLAAGE